MTPCAIKSPPCPGLATRGDYCAFHATGLRLMGKTNDVRKCERCRRPVKPGIWYREFEGDRIEHVKNCSKKTT